jgi:hypothetical protein
MAFNGAFLVLGLSLLIGAALVWLCRQTKAVPGALRPVLFSPNHNQAPRSGGIDRRKYPPTHAGLAVARHATARMRPMGTAETAGNDTGSILYLRRLGTDTTKPPAFE